VKFPGTRILWPTWFSLHCDVTNIQENQCCPDKVHEHSVYQPAKIPVIIFISMEYSFVTLSRVLWYFEFILDELMDISSGKHLDLYINILHDYSDMWREKFLSKCLWTVFGLVFIMVHTTVLSCTLLNRVLLHQLIDFFYLIYHRIIYNLMFESIIYLISWYSFFTIVKIYYARSGPFLYLDHVLNCLGDFLVSSVSSLHSQ
jgi:hypothetical protein